MAAELILVDTSILIDFYRKKDKRKSFFYELTNSYKLFAISVITEYEIFISNKAANDTFWELIATLNQKHFERIKGLKIISQNQDK